MNAVIWQDVITPSNVLVWILGFMGGFFLSHFVRSKPREDEDYWSFRKRQMRALIISFTCFSISTVKIFFFT